ncbi:hypothetical protein CGLO_18065 [Colletotrichum gloeosporioides Cg-14]|uniref:Uncharacterized protein n=1 Tax=Colletotrichum gloeosporioides (strain Cg-14) TaxID=1237896 RepID=T0KVC4_COLGC|nr:hypothetical protein CGLO_18065 [Colletotrichum gloeosporioides Cg-14]
MSITGKVILI